MFPAPRYVRLMNHNIRRLLVRALRLAGGSPGFLLFLLQNFKSQQKAARKRQEWERRGLHVPPYLIASITRRCNLKCHGCYAQAHQKPDGAELPVERWHLLFSEAQELGISFVLLAGGEPLTRPAILEEAAAFPRIIFPVFTNGTLFDEAMLNRFRLHRHLIPIVSIEGWEEATDARRGAGIFTRIQTLLAKLKKARLFFGVSITVTSKNLAAVTDLELIDKLCNSGCRLFIFVEYTPVAPGTAELTLDDAQRRELSRLVRKLETEQTALFTAFPGDEELYDGCLAAGRGFLHISPEGAVEPCPFAPLSDANLLQNPLREALQSPFLTELRNRHAELKESGGGCALWENRDWATALLGEKTMANPAGNSDLESNII